MNKLVNKYKKTVIIYDEGGRMIPKGDKGWRAYLQSAGYNMYDDGSIDFFGPDFLQSWKIPYIINEYRNSNYYDGYNSIPTGYLDSYKKSKFYAGDSTDVSVTNPEVTTTSDLTIDLNNAQNKLTTTDTQTPITPKYSTYNPTNTNSAKDFLDFIIDLAKSDTSINAINLLGKTLNDDKWGGKNSHTNTTYSSLYGNTGLTYGLQYANYNQWKKSNPNGTVADWYKVITNSITPTGASQYIGKNNIYGISYNDAVEALNNYNKDKVGLSTYINPDTYTSNDGTITQGMIDAWNNPEFAAYYSTHKNTPVQVEGTADSSKFGTSNMTNLLALKHSGRKALAREINERLANGQVLGFGGKGDTQYDYSLDLGDGTTGNLIDYLNDHNLYNDNYEFSTRDIKKALKYYRKLKKNSDISNRQNALGLGVGTKTTGNTDILVEGTANKENEYITNLRTQLSLAKNQAEYSRISEELKEALQNAN